MPKAARRVSTARRFWRPRSSADGLSPPASTSRPPDTQSPAPSRSMRRYVTFGYLRLRSVTFTHGTYTYKLFYSKIPSPTSYFTLKLNLFFLNPCVFADVQGEVTACVYGGAARAWALSCMGRRAWWRCACMGARAWVSRACVLPGRATRACYQGVLPGRATRACYHSWTRGAPFRPSCTAAD
jgi:hypothetical protein